MYANFRKIREIVSCQDSDWVITCGVNLSSLLTQVAFISELLENQRNDLVFFKIIPSHFCSASEASKIDRFKN